MSLLILPAISICVFVAVVAYRIRRLRRLIDKPWSTFSEADFVDVQLDSRRPARTRLPYVSFSPH